MHDRELSQADMEDIQRDLDQLIRLGLVEVNEDGGLALTDAGVDALHRANAQTWN
jgi:Mn-dependent DtxR family transcriptional regulator